MSWCVLHVRPKSEKKLAVLCRNMKVSHYLPLRNEVKVYQRRKVATEKPLFPGYFFMSMDDQVRERVLQTNYVIRFLPAANSRALVYQLAQIRKALRRDPSLQAVESFVKGRKVFIKGGPFMGIHGEVETLKSKSRVLLNVEMIGQSIVIEVDKDLLEPVT